MFSWSYIIFVHFPCWLMAGLSVYSTCLCIALPTTPLLLTPYRNRPRPSCSSCLRHHAFTQSCNVWTRHSGRARPSLMRVENSKSSWKAPTPLVEGRRAQGRSCRYPSHMRHIRSHRISLDHRTPHCTFLRPQSACCCSSHAVADFHPNPIVNTAGAWIMYVPRFMCITLR
ncbi:hypothetical protein OF83DRAFT_45287 [Amylostereum chailletii]|nr:hypothetical protein OF83DRAFT_45287 [Amylostereum chailletii]